jgi:hypothetical protein
VTSRLPTSSSVIAGSARSSVANVAATLTRPRVWTPVDRLVAIGYGAAVVLIVVALIVPPTLSWDVGSYGIAPLQSHWDPRVGPGTVPAIVVGAAGVVWGGRLAAMLPWRLLLLVGFAYGLAWTISLATVDGWGGIGDVLNGRNEYLNTARDVTSVSATLHEFVDRIPLDSDRSWPAHVAGHPAGALLFFVALVALGLGSGLAAGLVVIVLGATTAPAVLATVRALGAEDAARRAAPFLFACPTAIWMGVSADGMFAAVAAWGLCCLAVAATATDARRVIAWGVGAGLLLGCCVMLSYGLTLLGVLAVTVLWAGGSRRPLPWAITAAAVVVGVFAIAGFAWWEAFPILRTRYWAGIASSRPAAYWLWGDLASLCISAGPVVGVCVVLAIAAAMRRLRPGVRVVLPTQRVVVALTLAAAATIALADLSLMSKAETERIWLPFVPWLLVGTALVPGRWRPPLLAAQVAFALGVQSLLFTHW